MLRLGQVIVLLTPLLVLSFASSSFASSCTPSKTFRPGHESSPPSISSLPDRKYTLLIPPEYDGTVALPLIVSYHGHLQDSDNEYKISEFGDASVNSNYIVAYPQGLPGTDGEAAWQGAPYADPGVDDIAFTDTLLGHLIDMLCVDQDRIYVSGKSNGGGLVDTLACSDVGPRFAAFSACSGAFYTDLSFDGRPSCDATRDRESTRTIFPFLETHSGDDMTISYDGNPAKGIHGVTPQIPQWLDWWAQRNGCDTDGNGTSELSQDGKLNRTSWRCNGNDGVVQGSWAQNLGHQWPGTEGTDKTLDASPKILELYGQWTRQLSR